MKKAVIFDLDGTLLNTLESISYCSNLTLNHFNMPSVKTEEFPAFIGHGSKVLIERLFKFVNGDKNIFNDFSNYYMNIYNKNGAYGVKPYDGIIELLDSIRLKGIKTAILSNKPHAILKNVEKIYFEGKFDLAYGQRECMPPKPDPAMLYEILNTLGIDKSECIYCGDSEVDVQTGNNANVLMLGAAWGFYGDTQFENADAIVCHPTDILNYID